MKYYAGVGSRKTPPDVLELMGKAARWLRRQGWTLRSGHASGADWAFEEGAADPGSMIFLPWSGFGQRAYGSDPGRPVIGKAVLTPEAELLQYHAELVKLGIRRQGATSRAVRLLHGRNWLQVKDAKFVVCWAEEVNGEPQGGTATAVKLAEAWQVPVFNLWRQADRDRIEAKIGGAE